MDLVLVKDGDSKSGHWIDVGHKLFAYVAPDDVVIVERNWGGRISDTIKTFLYVSQFHEIIMKSMTQRLGSSEVESLCAWLSSELS